MFPVFSISEQTPEQISVKLFQATEEPSACDLPKNVSWPEIMIHYYSNRELRSSWGKNKKNKKPRLLRNRRVYCHCAEAIL